jgi:hypothetical protein
MADIVDQGNDSADLFLEVAMKNRERNKLPFTGTCHNCEDDIETNQHFCCVECRNDYESREKLIKQQGRPISNSDE